MSAVPKDLAGSEVQRMVWPQPAVERLQLERIPLLAAALFFAAGIFLARNWHPPIILLIADILLLVLAGIGLRVRTPCVALVACALWLGAGIWCAEIQPVPSMQRDLLREADGLSRTVQGRVMRIRQLPPIHQEENQDVDYTSGRGREDETLGTISVDLAVDHVEEMTPDVAWMAPVSGGVRLTVIGPPVHLGCGDSIEMPLRMKIPERYRDPGAWQYADYLLDQGIGARSTVQSAKIQTVGRTSSGMDLIRARCLLYAAQSWASNRLIAYIHSAPNRVLPANLRLTTDDAGMLNAMLFGDRTWLRHALRLGFERTGSFHLFVVSGMHVALLAALVFWLLRRLGLGLWFASVLTILFTAGYALLTGFGAPVQRALVMAAIFLIAQRLFREHSLLNAVGAAALAVLAWSPRSLFEASFQMTFLALFAIAGIAVPLGERWLLPQARATRRLREFRLDTGMPPRLAQLRVMLRVWGDAFRAAFGKRAWWIPSLTLRGVLWALELTLVGLVTESVMVLPMELYFHRATIFALPVNLISIPLVAVLAPAALLTFLASLLSPWLALLPGALTALVLHGVTHAVAHISQMHTADLRVPGPLWWISIAAFAVWLFCCWAVRRSARWAWVAVAALPLTTLAILWPQPALVTHGSLEVTAIDVGQGDSLLVVGPTGRAMLVDAGGPVGSFRETAETTNRFDVGEEVVSSYLWYRRLRRIDTLVLTHAHSDHMGGMAAVMQNFRPRELWVSVDPTAPSFQSLLREAATFGVRVRHLHAGESVAWDGIRVDILAPEASYRNSTIPQNNDSLVMRLEYGRSSVQLEGDAEAASERQMLEHNRLQPVTLLKVGHHGSRTSSTVGFLAETAPEDAVISAGRGNSFGHPHPEIVQRFAERHTRLYRTDEFGLTTFLLRPDGTIREVLDAPN